MGMLMGALSGIGEGLQQTGRLLGDQALEEQRSALAIERAKALEEIKQAPLNRFSIAARARAQEDVPVAAESIVRTTRAGAEAIGLKDGLQGMTREQVAAYNDPDMLAQFDAQLAADNQIAQNKVAGKTRKRTPQEAADAALQDTMLSDPTAAVAGAGLIHAVGKDDLEERKLNQKERIEQARIEQRDRHDDKQFESAMARFEAQVKNAQKTGNKQLEQQYAISLRTEINAIDREIREMERNKKGKFDDELTDIDAQIGERRGERKQLVELQNQYFKDSGINVPELPTPKSSGQANPPKPLGSLPDGAKQIGTSGGKPVYQTPDGKRFIAN